MKEQEINKYKYVEPFSSRQNKKIIREEGKRVSPYSKYWIWNDILWEPSMYSRKPASTYKPVNSSEKIAKILLRTKKKNRVIKVSKVIGKDEKIDSRFEILDL